MITNQGQEIRNFESPLQPNFDGIGSPGKLDQNEAAFLHQYNNIPPELLNDPNFIRQQQMIQKQQQQKLLQQQQFMQQQQQQLMQQQQYMNSPHAFPNGMNPMGFGGANDLDLSSDEELLDDIVPRRKPTETEALAEFLRRTGPEDMEPPAASQKKKKNSIFSFKKQNKKEKTKNIDNTNRPKHIPLITENDGNGLYSPNNITSPNNISPNSITPNSISPNNIGPNLQAPKPNPNMGMMSPEDQNHMMMQPQPLPGQKRPRKKTNSQILEEFLKTSNQAKQYMNQIQQINNSENQQKQNMMGYSKIQEQSQTQPQQQMMQTAFIQQQQFHQQQDPDDEEFEYKQAPVPTQQHTYMGQGVGGMTGAMPQISTSSSNGDRKPNSRHPPRTSSMVISHLLINQQGMEPYEVQQRMDEYALGINENGEIISDDEDELDMENDEFYSDEDDDLSADSEVIRNTKFNSEMRPENCSFIDDPIPKARTNKTVQFCEEVGEISDSDYYDDDSYYDDNEETYYDDYDDEIIPQPQPQMQNMSIQTSNPAVTEDMPRNSPKPIPQQTASVVNKPSGPNGKAGQKHVIHKTKLKDEDSNKEVKGGYNMVSLPPPEMATLEITYNPEEAELEEAEKELMQLEIQERNERRRSNGPPPMRRGPPGPNNRGMRDQRPISMSVNMKNLPSYHKHHPQNNDGSGPKPYPPNQPRPRRRHVQIQTRKPHLRSTSVQTDPEATKEYEALVEELNAASTEKNATIESLQEEVSKYRVSSQKLSEELKLAQERYQKAEEERDALADKNKELIKVSDEKQVQFDNLSAQAYTKIQDLVVSQQKLLRERHAMENEIIKLREELKKAKTFINQNYSNPSMSSPSTAPITPQKATLPTDNSNSSTPVLMENNNEGNGTLTKNLSPQQQMNYRLQQQQQQQMTRGSPVIAGQNAITQSMTPPMSATSSPGIYAQKLKSNGSPAAMAHRSMLNRVASPSPKPSLQSVEIVEAVPTNNNAEN